MNEVMRRNLTVGYLLAIDSTLYLIFIQFFNVKVGFPEELNDLQGENLSVNFVSLRLVIPSHRIQSPIVSRIHSENLHP